MQERKQDLGDRRNKGKAKFSLINLSELENGCRVLEFGAEKYARNNYQKGLVFSEILDSMMRHISKLQDGEWVDEESGLPHIGHIQANAIFLGVRNNVIDLEFTDKK